MKRKEYKVVLRGEDKEYLQEVYGYFTWLNGLRVFIYYDRKYRMWYVIDLDTGLAFAKGESMVKAKVDAFAMMDKFKKLKLKDEYKQKRFLYNKLLGEYKNEKNNSKDI